PNLINKASTTIHCTHRSERHSGIHSNPGWIPSPGASGYDVLAAHKPMEGLGRGNAKTTNVDLNPPSQV
ncbi:MAG: hypothetical protein ACAH95_02945, partial [Fimbriimonas sp.]